MRNISLFTGIMLFLTACTKTAITPDISSNALTPSNSNTRSAVIADASTLMNVSYGTDPLQTMDIYLPPNRAADSTKLVFMIHGGGWVDGDKEEFYNYLSYLQALLPEYAFINLNYRLVANGQSFFPAQENDIQAAASFVFNKRSEYGISDKWVFLGASAGAHLAMLQSYKYSSPVIPKAVVSFFGQSDLTSLYYSNPDMASLLGYVTGTNPEADPTLYQQSSPSSFITAQSPPTILLHGGIDNTVPPAQSTLVRDKLQSLDVPNQYVLYPNDAHGWEGSELADSFEKIAAFLKLHVQ